MSASNTRQRRQKTVSVTRQPLCVRCDSLLTLRMWDLVVAGLGVVWLGASVVAPWLATQAAETCLRSPAFVVLGMLGIVTFLAGIVAPACWFQLFRAKRQLVQSCCGLTCVLSALGMHHTLACEQTLVVWFTGHGVLVRALYGVGGMLIALAAWQRLRHPQDACRKCGGLRVGRLV